MRTKGTKVLECVTTRYSPILQGPQCIVEFSRCEVPACGIFDFKLLELLVEASAKEVCIDAIDDEVFDGADRREV